MRRTTVISLICASLLAGVALGRLGYFFVIPVVVAAVAVTLTALRHRRLLPLGLMLLALGLGQYQAESWTSDRARLTGLIGQSITVTGQVIDDPVVSDKGRVSYTLGDLNIGGQATPGDIAVYQHPVRLLRGHRVELTGKLKAGYGNDPVALSFPKLTVLSQDQDALEQFRGRFFAGIRTALPEPIASFGLGLLVGIRALIPKDLQETLTIVGLSHLVAVSGYNLTIIVRATDRLLKRAGRSVALVTNLWLIGAFLVITGASASIVRASLVSVLSLLAAFYGRAFHPVTLILLAAAATAGFDPKYLTDLGWLLSFLAFFGILVLAPAVEARLNNPKPVAVRLFVESTAAHIMTLPLILYFFSDLSVVAPLTNLIVLPLIPLAMAVSFLAGVAGMAIPAFAGWLAWPAGLLLGFILQVVAGFAALPWAAIGLTLTLPGMLAMYAVILALTLAIGRAARRRGRTATKPRLTELATIKT
jgi:competence protein ComEC